MRAALQAARRGLARTLRVRRIVVWLWLANLLFALPMATVVSDAMHDSIGPSQIGRSLLQGLDLVWHTEYRSKAPGVGRSFEPSQLGVGAFLDNLELWFTGRMFTGERGLVAAGIAYALLWALMLGGALESLRSGERATLRGFFGFGGEFFFRFVRVAALMAGGYYLVYKFARWLFGKVEFWVRDVTVERTVFAYYLMVAVGVIILLVALRMAADYAKIAIVYEDRRSALLAILRGFRFVIGSPVRTFGLAFSFAVAGALLLWVYDWIAPGAGQSTWVTVVGAFLVSQLFLLVRLFMRLSFLGGEIELYDGSSHFPAASEVP